MAGDTGLRVSTAAPPQPCLPALYYANPNLYFELAYYLLALIEAKSSKTASPSLLAGAKRIRRHFDHLSGPCDVTVAYGGDKFQQRSEGRLVPWRALRAANLSNSHHSVAVFAGDRPVAAAAVLAVFPDKTSKLAVTDESGVAELDLHAVHLPMTVFAAAEGLEAHAERDWTPAERALHVDLSAVRGGGSVIFREGAGYVPDLPGRLDPIRDTLDRTYVHTSNIAVNGGEGKPVAVAMGEDLRLTAADGNERLVRIIEIAGRSALVEYRPYRAN